MGEGIVSKGVGERARALLLAIAPVPALLRWLALYLLPHRVLRLAGGPYRTAAQRPRAGRTEPNTLVHLYAPLPPPPDPPHIVAPLPWPPAPETSRAPSPLTCNIPQPKPGVRHD